MIGHFPSRPGAVILGLLASAPLLAGCTESEGDAATPAVIADDTRIVLVTGSTGGLGREVALALGAEGAHVIVHGRNEERGREVVDAIRAEETGSAEFHAADLASFDEVRAFAQRILDDYDRIDVLVNNAGIWLDGPDERQLSPDGHELHLQVNYLSGYLLSHLLLPLLEASDDARIVNVASAAQRPMDFDDPMMDEGYSHGRAYGQSKLAQITFTMDLAQELSGRDITVTALHPATFMDTEMVLSRGAEPRASVQEGVEAVLQLVNAPGIASGTYYNGLSEARANDQAYDPEAQEALRRLSRELTGVPE
jgi:NAD(P)-dependent dehydrogenase (short-subunit alcohol dehydrogenase family)